MTPKTDHPLNIVFIVRLYPPVNSSGAKRAEALSKYFARMGHNVSVVTPAKTLTDGELTEPIPQGVNLIELDHKGRDSESRSTGARHEPLFAENRSLKRRIKDTVMQSLGQLPDPRLPFILGLRSARLSARADAAFRDADVVIGSCPPWSMLLGAILVKRRYGKRVILDYRDHFADNWEMPGSRIAKWLERRVDRALITRADHVVAISGPMRDYYVEMSDTPVDLIMNGFDHEKVDAAGKRAKPAKDDLVRIRHTGIVTPARLPHALFRALVIFKAEQPDQAARIRLEFYGYSDVFQRAVRENYSELADQVGFFATVPHDEVLELMHSADYLLFCGMVTQKNASARGVLTTKLFEYLGAGRPILAHADPDTLAADLIRDCGGDHLVSDQMDDYLSILQSPAFFARKPAFVGDKVVSLTRESQAIAYAALAHTLATEPKGKL